jgi:hypothetical protein
MEINFVQFSRGRAGRKSGASNKPMEDVMNTLATKLTTTAATAALICATPVSIDLVRPGTAGPQGPAPLALALDTAQAHPAGGGHEAGSRGAAGNHERASHASDRRAGGGDRAANVRGSELKGNDIRANNIHANDVRLNNVNVNVNDINATRVNATYVRPPYPVRPWVVAATTAAVGTTVAVLPASCTLVQYNGVTYHHCGDSYYVASNGAYVAVDPPR